MNMHTLPRAWERGRGNLSVSLPLIYPRRIALAAMFIMTARAFYYFPGMSGPSELWNVLCFLFLCFVYLSWKVKNGGRFTGLEIYVLIMMLIAPIWSGVMAQQVFGQPFFDGLLSQRSIICGVGALALLLFYRAGWINSEDCRQGFLIPAWLTLVSYTFFTIVMGAGESSSANEPTLKFFWGYIQIGFFYYGLIGFNKKSKIHYGLSALFLIYLISTGQRAMLLTTLGTYGLFVLVRGSFARLMVFIPASMCGIAALVGIFYIINPGFTTDLAVRIGEAVTVVTTGQKTADVSANARLKETAMATPYVSQSLLLGNGNISNHWKGGYSGVIGRFYPTDIGLIGAVYVYGILGTLLFIIQFWWARRYAKGASQGVNTEPMADAIMAYLISYLVLSTTTGSFVFNFQSGVLAIMYLYIVSDETKAKAARRRPTGSRSLNAGLWGLQNRS